MRLFHFTSIILTLTISVCGSSFVLAQTVTCASTEVHEEALSGSTEYRRSFFELQDAIEEMRQNNDRQSTNNEVLKVPIVVHVMHTGVAIGTKENITEEQILSAIEGLNEDFRKISGTNGDGLGVDVEIEFCLASRTPDGEPTNGIIRVDASSVTYYADQGIKSGNIGEGADETELKSFSVWPREDYLNIWVVSEIDNNEAGGGTQGFAYFPFNDVRDGITILYNAFGKVGNLKTYTDLNRTITHEVGHSLGLYHTFYNTNSASQCTNETNCETQGDQVCDTPSTTANSMCSGSVNCPDAQVENYMDYTDENCRNTFTQGQSDRMRTTLTTARATLLESLGCTPVAELDLAAVSFINPGIKQCTPEVAPELELQNLGNSTIYNFEILLSVDNNSPIRVLFSDSIEVGKSIIATLPSISIPYGPHTISASVTLESGELDGWSPNDYISHSFVVEESDFWTISVSPDAFAGETTWALVDSNSVEIMSGGPYENNNSAPYIQTGCVSVGCYELTIYDSAGDGMQFGGSYSLSSANGDILAEGADTYGDHFGFEEVSQVCALPLQLEGCEDLNENNICDSAEVLGCQESSACNFNPLSNINDDSCSFPEEEYSCNGDCIQDIDGDGICDAFEIIGCTDPSACNYNAEATDQGKCTYAEYNYDCEGNSTVDSIDDIVEGEIFKIYPNPYSNETGSLFIQTSSSDIILLKIVGTDGRLVWEGNGIPYTEGIQIFMIDETISPGTYIAHLGSLNPFSAIPLMIR
ncbi:MAG: hypothetical protein COA49_01900 [Bacteroidetes bacterium]|nr:MAG: hypothetical protein COA49_01900 [Bacteroidota bacterium]